MGEASNGEGKDHVSQGGNDKAFNLTQEPPSSVSPQGASSINRLVPVLAVLLVSFAVYVNALSGDFVYDDTHQVLENPWIKDIGNIPEIFSKNVWGFRSASYVSNYYRPLMHIVYMFDYGFSGLNPWGFHLINLLFHCGVSVLVFLTIRELFGGESAPSSYRSPPLVAAMLFAAHPIHAEAVAWIAGLPDLGFTFFFLLSFYFHIRSRAVFSVSYWISVACYAVAALFKEPALTLPAILFAYDYAFRSQRPRLADYAKQYAPYMAVAIGYLVLRVHALGGFAPKVKPAALSAYQYAINVFPLFIQYLGKLLLPLDLNAYYVFHPISSLGELKGALSLAATAVFAVLFAVAMKKSRVAFLGLVFLTVPLLPALYIPALGANAFTERYLYLPSFGYVLILASLLSLANKKLPRAGAAVAIALIAVAGLYAVGTVRRNTLWKDNVSLWTDTVMKSPDSAVAHDELGAAYKAQGRLDRAVAEFQIALRLEPSFAFAYNNLGAAYKSQGRLDSAVEAYQAALRLEPDSADTHYNLGNAYASQGRPDMAAAEFQASLRLHPDFAWAHYNLGLAYESEGRPDMAAEEFRTALRLKPDSYKALQSLNDILSRRR